jgi:hypothetical protein
MKTDKQIYDHIYRVVAELIYEYKLKPHGF